MIAPEIVFAAPPGGSALIGERAEAAVRWRMGAATLDNLLVSLGYGVLCALAHWRATSLSRLWLLFAMGVAYHFVFELQDGRTPGKRRYGIQVVMLDGSALTARAVAIRSVLRIIDQLPTMYVSGLINMVRTGPARRQRIGDVAAGTTVIAVDGRSLHGSPAWLLPGATLLATALSALSLWGIVRANHSPLTDAQRADFVAGCENSLGGQAIDCTCLLQRLEADGYTTPARLSTLGAEWRDEIATRTIGPGLSELRSAAGACRRV